MKNFIRTMLITGSLLFFVQNYSYAIVDASVYGGYTFSGTVEDTGFEADVDGLLYGVKGHYNTSLIPLIELGVGAYYQFNKMQYESSGSDFDLDRQSLGLDLNLILSLPIIHPYGRFTWAVVDSIKTETDTYTENFKAWGAGVGVEFTIIPFFRVFGEYMYDKSKQDFTLTTNSAIIGVKFDF